MEMQEGDDRLAEAARILASLRSRPLRRWPEWVPPAPSADALLAAGWSVKGPRLLRRPRAGERSAVVALEAPNRGQKLVSTGPAPMPGMPLCCGTAAGSGHTTSGGGAARQPPAAAAAAEEMPVPKVDMEVSTPDTPLEQPTSAPGSGVSSSVDDSPRSPAKRKSPGGGGSGASSSDDEDFSSPSKRARGDGGEDQLESGANNAADKEILDPSLNRDKNGAFLFDLNEPLIDQED